MIPTTSQPLNNVQWFGVGTLNLVLQQLEVMDGQQSVLVALDLTGLSKAGFLLSSD